MLALLAALLARLPPATHSHSAPRTHTAEPTTSRANFRARNAARRAACMHPFGNAINRLRLAQTHATTVAPSPSTPPACTTGLAATETPARGALHPNTLLALARRGHTILQACLERACHTHALHTAHLAPLALATRPASAADEPIDDPIVEHIIEHIVEFIVERNLKLNRGPTLEPLPEPQTVSQTLRASVRGRDAPCPT